MRKDRLDMKRFYEEDGMTCADIAFMFRITRQSVHEVLKNAGTNFRRREPKPFIMYDGLKWTLTKDGYYRATSNRKRNVQLNRHIWVKHFGEIPLGYDICYRDGDRMNNEIDNLECLPRPEAVSKYSPHHNQHKNNKNDRPSIKERPGDIAKKNGRPDNRFFGQAQSRQVPDAGMPDSFRD